MIVELLNENAEAGGRTISWAAMRPGDVGVAFPFPPRRHVVAATAGTFGEGGAMAIDASHDGENWFALKGPLGEPIVQRSAIATRIHGEFRFIRPRCTSGDDATVLATCIHIRKR